MEKKYYIGAGLKKQGVIGDSIIYTGSVICTPCDGCDNAYDIILPGAQLLGGRSVISYDDDLSYKDRISIRVHDIVINTILSIRNTEHKQWLKMMSSKTKHLLHFVADTDDKALIYDKNKKLIAELRIAYAYKITKLSSKHPYIPKSIEHKLKVADIDDLSKQYMLFGCIVDDGHITWGSATHFY